MQSAALFSIALILSASGAIEQARSQYEDFEFDRAQLTLQKALSSPDLSAAQKAEAHIWLGLCKLQADDTEGARQSFAQGLALDMSVILPDLASPKASKVFQAEKDKALAAADKADAASAAGASNSEQDGEAQNAWQPYTALGLGAGAAVFLVGGGLMAALSVDQSARATDPQAFADEAAQAASAASQYSAAATGLFVGTGLLAIGAGAVGALWLTQDPKSEPSP